MVDKRLVTNSSSKTILTPHHTEPYLPAALLSHFSFLYFQYAWLLLGLFFKFLEQFSSTNTFFIPFNKRVSF